MINKAIIPAAGFGKRLRPISHFIPKEMFPVGKYPAIEWVIAEALVSGLNDICIVVNRQKKLIRDYLIANAKYLEDYCRIIFIIQEKPLGLAHALWQAKNFIDGQPFAVLLPDELVWFEQLPIPELSEAFEKYGGQTFGLHKNKLNFWWGQGKWSLRDINDRIYAVEACGLKKNLPFLVGFGRYILSNEFLFHTEKLLRIERKKELDDGTVFDELIKHGDLLLGVHVDETIYDISMLDGFIAACKKFGMANPLKIVNKMCKSSHLTDTPFFPD